MQKTDFNSFEIMVDIGECYSKVAKLPDNIRELCSEPECIEDAKYMVVYEDTEEKIYLCQKHFEFIRTNTFCYAIENVLDNPKVQEIPVVFGEDKKVKVSYLGTVDIVHETEDYLRSLGLLDSSESLDVEVFLSMLRAHDRIAYANIVNDKIFAYLLDESNDEYIITEKEWKEILQRLGEYAL
ncbi:conserved hypothetical protein [Caldicellulosiruptor hydrothermalis 108]|uniref:Uncharacterized protein n=1 Tax=Caldicellulosiruptor hydrothermalis (strain DSM 18901 / VKM B-2411 / 108) TaxID=632292 RepID=E4QBG1_CALH1|nr:hypothetical protein [Caldicellulosiruptor hydrothermalis]ADQ06063.1 conserved hypothetical protein [Caldicellulosiruptor hydrothermalis 108]